MSDRYPILDTTNSGKRNAAVIKKLIKSGNPEVDEANRKGTIKEFSYEWLSAFTKRRSTIESDNDKVIDLLPDIKRIMWIYIANILHQTNTQDTNLLYDVSSFPGESKTIISECLGEIKEYIEGNDSLKQNLPRIVRRICFETGSYPLLILPDSSLDKIMESGIKKEELLDYAEKNITDNNLIRSTGYLGNPEDKVSDKHHLIAYCESLDHKAVISNANIKLVNHDTVKTTINTGKSTEVVVEDISYFNKLITVNDNIDELKLPKLYEMLEKKKRSIILESYKEQNDAYTQFYDKNFKNVKYKQQPIVMIDIDGDSPLKNKLDPTVIDLPSGCVIPICAPNSKIHQGYFVAADRNNNPLSTRDSTDIESNDIYGAMRTADGASGNLPDQYGSLIRQANLMKAGYGTGALDNSQIDAKQLYNTFEDLIIHDLCTRLKNGSYNGSIVINKGQEAIRMMFARALHLKETKLIFVPPELMVYYAYEYDANGIGVSLIEKTRFLSSLRVMANVVDTLSAIKSSINHDILSIDLTESDIDPETTVTKLVHMYSNSNSDISGMLYEFNPLNISYALKQASVKLKVSGNEYYPSVNTNLEQVQRTYNPISQELKDELRKQQLFAFGLSPEQVDGTEGTDFAITAILNNSISQKQFQDIQTELLKSSVKFVKAIIMNSPNLYKRLVDIVKANKKKLNKKIIKEFIGESPEQLRLIDEDNATGGVDKKDNIKNTKKVLGEKKLDIDENIVHAYVQRIINNITLSIPNDTTTVDKKKESFDTHTAAINEALDFILSEEVCKMMFKDFDPDVITSIKKYISGKITLDWMRDNNYLKEITDIFKLDESGIPIGNLLTDYDINKKVFGNVFDELISEIKKAVTPSEDQTSTDNTDETSETTTDEGSNKTDESDENVKDEEGGVDTDETKGEEKTEDGVLPGPPAPDASFDF